MWTLIITYMYIDAGTIPKLESAGTFQNSKSVLSEINAGVHAKSFVITWEPKSMAIFIYMTTRYVYVA